MKEIYTGNVEATGRNGGIKQYILIQQNRNLFRIMINFESYKHQSYAILEHYNKCGWATMIRENPHNYLKFSYKYSEQPSDYKNIFNEIIEHLINLIDKILED